MGLLSLRESCHLSRLRRRRDCSGISWSHWWIQRLRMDSTGMTYPHGWMKSGHPTSRPTAVYLISELARVRLLGTSEPMLMFLTASVPSTIPKILWRALTNFWFGDPGGTTKMSLSLRKHRIGNQRRATYTLIKIHTIGLGFTVFKEWCPLWM